MKIYRFGPFALDPTTRQLFRGRSLVRLSGPQFAVLMHLVTHSGRVVSRETLIHAGWGGAAISDNSLEQTISRNRKALGQRRDETTYIETLPHQGYRFTAAVQQAERLVHTGSSPIEAELAPFLAFVQGRTELDTLRGDGIERARREFEQVLRDHPEYAPAHVGLAIACGFRFEASAAEVHRDTASLAAGIRHAHKACELAPSSGDAWSALAFVLCLHGDMARSSAAACKAMALEPENWRHALTVAYVSWGEERLRAARRVLTLCPGLALAHWLQATVFIARGAFEPAADVLRAGCAAQDAQAKGTGFPAVGLHLLHAHVLAAEGLLPEAVEELMRELSSSADCGQLYARECTANTWYALGAVRLRQRERAEAEKAFTRALEISPGHIPAAAALRGEVPGDAGRNPAEAGLYNPAKAGLYNPAEAGLHVDAAIGQAIVLARGNRHREAALVIRDALTHAPPGPAGWLLPVEPMLNPLAHPEEWAETLAMIRIRAS